MQDLNVKKLCETKFFNIALTTSWNKFKLKLLNEVLKMKSCRDKKNWINVTKAHTSTKLLTKIKNKSQDIKKWKVN